MFVLPGMELAHDGLASLVHRKEIDQRVSFQICSSRQLGRNKQNLSLLFVFSRMSFRLFMSIFYETFDSYLTIPSNFEHCLLN